MRITVQLLRKYSCGPLGEVERLDLSDSDIVAIERLYHCKRLQTLVLSNNRVSILQNVNCCQNLWIIDLTGNRLKSLQGLSQFPALGCLRVGYNELEWTELHRLSHMILLSLSLCGNSQLDSDPHYRKHVVDILPNLWMLDQRIITAEERKKVIQFFLNSDSSAQHVWRKTAEKVFTPTSMKNLMVTGVFGEKTTHMMSQFPVTFTHSTVIDRRRLNYLAHTLEQEMRQEVKYRKHLAGVGVPNLTQLMEGRDKETEQSNMLLLLLLAHLEYGLPHGVVKATLDTAKLAKIGGVDCMSVFRLPSHMMMGVASLLLSASAIDREDKNEGGLYAKLFQSLCHALDCQHRKTAAITAGRPVRTGRKLTPQERQSDARMRCLLASEVVHLMCLVPLFFEHLERDQGLLQLVSVATSNPHVADVISSLTWKAQAKGGDVWDVYHDIASFLLHSTSDIVQGKRKRGTPLRRRHSAVHRTTSQLLTSTQPRSSLHRTRAHSATHLTLRSRPSSSSSSSRSSSHFPRATHLDHMKQPELGDLILTSSEQVARIVALPEKMVAVLQLMSAVTSSSPAPDSYFYTDTQGLHWDHRMGYWTHQDDLTTEQSETQLNFSLDSTNLAPSDISVTRTMTPEPTRPHSGMSFASDFDLQTIPSESEIELEPTVPRPSSSSPPPPPLTHPQPPMRVDINDGRPPSARNASSEEARTEHQKHVLTQLSHDQGSRDNNKTPTPTSSPSPPFLSPPTKELTVPSPQVHLLDTWQSSKSIPLETTSSTKAHSCQDKPSSPSHPSASHATSLSTPFLIPSSSSALSPQTSPSLEGRPDGIVYNAWSVVRPSSIPKQTILSSTRLMNRRETRTPITTSHSRGRMKSAPAGRLWTNPGVGGRATTTVIIQPRTYHPPPLHATSSQSRPGRYHYNPVPQTHRAPSTRKLGDMRGLFVGGTSLL